VVSVAARPQPPAKFWQASGLQCPAQAGGLPECSRWLSKAWRATPPGNDRKNNSIPEGCQNPQCRFFLVGISCAVRRNCVMPSTHLSLHYHVVFATRGRELLISKTWRGQLHEYIGGTLRGLDAVAECVGGVADHVHVLMGLRASHCLADVMRELKKASSAWAADKMREDTRFANMAAPFAWQEGYAAFTVSASSCAAARAYIENQEEHHRVKSFREELVEMLDRAGVEYRVEFLD